MKINSFIALICMLMFMFLCYACSSKAPDRSTLKRDLEKGLNWRPLTDSLIVNKVLTLVDVQLTRSSINCNEQCECILEFKGKVRSTDTFYYSSQYKGVYREIPEWGLGNKPAWKRSGRGRFYEFAGTAYYDLFDTGWKIRQFDAPILDSSKEKVSKFYIPKIVLKEKTSLF